MKILIVSSYLPYPLFSGGHIRLYNVIKELSLNHEITLVCEKRDYQTVKDEKEISKLCKKVIIMSRIKQWSIKNVLKTSFSLYPFLLIGHMNKLMKIKIEELLEKEKFDLIHVETFYIMQNLPKTSIPVILVEHNIEYLVYKRFLQQLPLIFRPLLSIDVAKIKYWEQKFWRESTKVIAVSEEEKKLIPRKDVVVVPNGVNIGEFKPRKKKLETNSKKILFIGDFKWIQNRDAMRFILTEIWPLLNLKLKQKNLKIIPNLWVVGKKIPESIQKLKNNENVFFDENAPSETFKIFEEADLLLAPIRVGGGTSFKILEAMSSGVPVITTSLGIEGIKAMNRKDVLIADDKESLTDEIINIFQDNIFYEKIKENARKLVEKKYDWKIIVKTLEETYESVVYKNNS